MSITRQLLELMGSRLNVKSEYGKGSVFSFTVKQGVVKWEELGAYSDRSDTAETNSYEYHELFHAPDARILIVDDTEMNLTVMISLLKKTQIRIDTASSGEEAIRLAAEKHYDVIFIDHMMPDMDGIETLGHIRASGKCRNVPVIALTANALSGAREVYLEAGFTEYLSKPVDGLTLEKLLKDKLPEDKVLEARSDEEGSGEQVFSEIMERLKDLDEIEEREGLANCGSEEGYRSVLSVFHRTAETKADEIEAAFRSGDIRKYTIMVHALKSSARIIGAGELSEQAAQLEEAGKREDTEYIGKHTDRLLRHYRELDQKLSWLDRKEEDLPGISPEARREAYQTIIEIADCMDYGMMENLLGELRGYELSGEDRTRFDGIERALTELDWDRIKQTAEEGMGA